MKSKITLLSILVLLTAILLAATPLGAGIRGKIQCFTESGNCVEAWNGNDVAMYRDAGGTETIRMDGDGAVRIAVPTQVGTATPGLVIQQGANGNALEIRNSGGTPVSSISGAGVLSGFGSSGLSVAPNLVVAAPTAIGTATPAALIDNAGVSTLLEIRDAATPVFQINNGGLIDLNGNQLDLDADNDTSITASTDDQIDIEIGGADDFAFKANSFELASGSIVDINGAADGLVLDADADTSLSADTDDQINVEIGGADELTLTAAALDMNDTIVDQDLGTENLGVLPSVCTASITYTAAAGGTGAVCTVGASEVWFVHAVYVNVTTNFDATGDDATLVIGDGNDPNGLIDLVDAELQAADTEGTGAPAGWQGFMSTDTIGAYLAQGLGFVYVGAETIDWLAASTGDDLSAGEATIYVVYTRIQ